jgi:hypothetical protein
MALLLRMGGVPARVAAGFTAGTYNPPLHRWVVTDLDAHAWVEAWFPRYGWVRFDPTPAAAPARGGRAPLGAGGAAPNPTNTSTPAPVRNTAGNPLSGLGHKHPTGQPSASAGWLIAGGVVGALLAVLAAVAVSLRGRRPPAPDTLVAELERALTRAGRPLAGGTTLAALEDRFQASPEASAYVRAIRVGRFGPGGAPPTTEQRRALRAQLWAGLGPGAAVRALWALPPGWPRRSRRSG